jgi:hypothetical protein
MQFCPKCDNIMDIGKTSPKISFIPEPTSLSATTVTEPTTTQNVADNDQIIKIINMFKNGFDISNEKVDTDILSKHKEFISLKDKDRKELIKTLKMVEDDSQTAYIICKNCSYSEKLIKRTLLLNKISKNSITEFDDLSKYKYMRYDNTLPHTRDYICKNKECKSNKDHTLKNAKWFRPNQSSYVTYYVCCECGTVWNIA